MTKKNYKTIELDPKYIPKKTEEYMCETQRAYFYKLLHDMREEITATMNDVMGTLDIKHKTEGVADDFDTTTFEIEADMRLHAHERSVAVMGQIDAALDRLEKGTFGYSVLSGDEIGLKRLMARPFAPLTLEEQEESEKKRR
ncbi:MAG: hypothetical protein FWE64_02775 [Alphaproteobacteria bacterium]|nr:hypothetical protein [Alphaproteobacteria bacterium]